MKYKINKLKFDVYKQKSNSFFISISPMLFVGSNYYPSGGWNDFCGCFKTFEHAKKWVEKNKTEKEDMWAHIVLDGVIYVTGTKNTSYEPLKWCWEG